MLAIAALPWLRLWADQMKRQVPYPNFISASPYGLASLWGNPLYVTDDTGAVSFEHAFSINSGPLFLIESPSFKPYFRLNSYQ